MLVWATAFPAACGNAIDILPAGRDWLLGSPDRVWRPEHFSTLPAEGELVQDAAGGQTILMGRCRIGEEIRAGLQHTRQDAADRQWITELVACESGQAVRLAVRVTCNLLTPQAALPALQAPYAITHLLATFGGGADGSLTVADTPHRLAAPDVERAARLIEGADGCTIPVVYASAMRTGRPAIDADSLARRLAGLAHVVVEPSVSFSYALAARTARTNPYAGAVSVYRPGGAHLMRYLPRDFSAPEQMENVIAECVRLTLTTLRPTAPCSWAALRESLSATRLADLRVKGSTEINDWVTAFDEELAAKEARLQAAQAEIADLREEIGQLQASRRADTDRVLVPGREPPAYPGELRDAVVQSLLAGRAALTVDGRRRAIIDDLLAANPPSGLDEEIAAEIKGALATLRTFGKAERAALENLGFTVTTGGKHIKAVYRDDERCTFSIPQTTSDARAGRNTASDIVRKLFR